MTIGYTTGVYDMFHIGHLNILRRAKEQCDFLIVGVSTDELVQKEKNKTPIIPFSERCAIIEAIRYVDKVVPQEDKNKWRLGNGNILIKCLSGQIGKEQKLSIALKNSLIQLVLRLYILIILME